MFGVSAPDTTNEGWNTWPTEKVSHALVNDRRAMTHMRALTTSALENAPADVAALRLAPVIREAVEEFLSHGGGERLRDSLVAFALSRVDWLQLAESQVEAAADKEVFPGALAASGAAA
jgi:hypothetical protein